MRVFLTGATGFIGSFLVPELINAGHHVVGLSRSDAGAEALTRAGAEVFRGDVNDLDRLRTAAEAADGVIHAAFNHDFSNLKQNSEDDRKVIETLGEALAGSDRPLVITSGTGLARSKTGGPAVETDDHVTSAEFPRAASEEAADALIAKGGRVMVMRLPQVHDTRRQGRIALAYPVGAATGPGGVCRRGQEPLAGRARLRRRPALPAGAREGPGRRALQRRRRGRCCPARHRRGDRCGVEDAGRVDHAGGGAGVLRLAGAPRHDRSCGLQRADAQSSWAGTPPGRTC